VDAQSSATCRTILLSAGLIVAVLGVVGLFGIREDVLAGVLDGLVTLAFVGAGLWAIFRVRSTGACLLALLGVSYGLANFDNILSIFVALGGAADVVRATLGLFYAAVLVHFLMVVPRPKRMLHRPAAVWLLYLPFLTFLIFSVAEGFVPRLRDRHLPVLTVVDMLYMALALVALGHSWFSLSRDERRASGFYWIPAGLLVAIGPFLALALVGLVAPAFSMPGQDYLVLLGTAIPIGMALAVVKGAGVPPQSAL